MTARTAHRLKDTLRALLCHLRNGERLLGALLIILGVNNVRLIAARMIEYNPFFEGGLFLAPALSLLVLGLTSVYLIAAGSICFLAPPAVARSNRLLPNITALLGGFGVYSLALLTPSSAMPFGAALPSGLVAAGAALVLLSLLYLGRSFSVTPEFRRVVRSGPYAFMRHPMYIGNIISIIGMSLIVGTKLAITIAAAVCALQLLRARYEEELLCKSDASYRTYRDRVGNAPLRIAPRVLAVGGFVLFGALLFSAPNSVVEAKPVSRSEFSARCRQWYSAALAGEYFSRADQKVFADYTDNVLAGRNIDTVPGCADFARLQKKCESSLDEWYNYQGDGTPKQKKRAALNVIKAIENTQGCKSIVGETGCSAIVEQSKLITADMPGASSFLRDCSDRAVSRNMSDLLRPAV